MRISKSAVESAYRRMAATGMMKTGTKGAAVATAIGHLGGRNVIRSDVQALKAGRRRVAVGGAALGGMVAWQGLGVGKYRRRYGRQQPSGVGGMTPRSTGGYA